MIKIDSAEFLDELITRIGDIDDYALAQQAAIPILAKHLGVTPGEIEWRDFRREGYHVDPPGRFFVNGEPVKFKLTPMFGPNGVMEQDFRQDLDDMVLSDLKDFANES